MESHRRLKILFVSPYLPHPRAGHGTAVFMHGLLRHIAQRHDITFLSFCNKDELLLAQDLNDLPIRLLTVPRGRGAQKSLFWNVYLIATRLLQALRSVVLWQPYYASKYGHPRMARTISQLTGQERFDIVQLEMTQMGQYMHCVRQGSIVLHEHDVSFRPAYRRFRKSAFPFERIVTYLELCRWFIYERKVARGADQVLCVTEQDVKLLRRLTGVNHISYFPRGVDVPEGIVPYTSRSKHSILFVGTFSHAPNVDAALWLVQEIFPKVIEDYPDAQLRIVGLNPPKELLSAALPYPQVRILGFVEDIESCLRTSSVFVAPLRFGGGVKVKVLHAMAEGIPVVATRTGLEGIDGISGENALVGESAERIARQIGFLFDNPADADRIGINGWKCVAQFYSWPSTVSRLEKIYSDVDRGH